LRGRTGHLKYLLYLPEAYHSGNDLWPLMLFLHGAGERGDNLEQLKSHGPPKLVAQGQRFPVILVSPQCPRGQYWSSVVLGAMLDEVTNVHRVDLDRVYLTGISMGGFGAWELGGLEPERFAAVAPICGGGDPELACRLKEVPVWAFHGAEDDIVPLEASEMMVDALRECGGNVRFTVYPGVGHDSWTPTYNNPELYDWLLAQQRSRTEG
jgi:predicted peptidase